MHQNNYLFHKFEIYSKSNCLVQDELSYFFQVVPNFTRVQVSETSYIVVEIKVFLHRS